MNRSTRIFIVLIGMAFAAGSFVATYAWPPSTSSAPNDAKSGTSQPCAMKGDCRCVAAWLRLSPDEAQQLASIAEPFAKDRPQLEAALYAERQKLADLFESDEATNEEILEQVERVIAANGALERCVAAYLVSMRPHLTDGQRARLYRRCAQGVREAGGCRWRYRGDGESPGCAEMKGCPKKIMTIKLGECCPGATSRPACHKQPPAQEE